MKNYIIILSIFLSFVASQSASAQWQQTRSTDAFTDKTKIITKNVGRILDGQEGATSLVHRVDDGVTDIYWNTPDGFLCESTVFIRIDEAEPIEVDISLSTDRTSVFFRDGKSVMEAMVSSAATRIQLKDDCGGYIVAEFKGNADQFLPQYRLSKAERLKLETAAQAAKIMKAEKAKNISLRKEAALAKLGWKTVSAATDNTLAWQKTGKEKEPDFIQFVSDFKSFTYRRANNPVGPPYATRFAKVKTYHDLAFAVYDENLILKANNSSDVSKILLKNGKKTRVEVGGKRFKADVRFQWKEPIAINSSAIPPKFPQATTGVATVFISEPEKVELLYKELINPENTSAKVRLNGKVYIISFPKFAEAVSFYD